MYFCAEFIRQTMKHTKLWAVCLPLLAACAACSNSDDTTPAPSHNDTFRIADIINPVVRTPQLDDNGAGHFTAGDKNTLFFRTAQAEAPHSFTYTHGTEYRWSDLNLGINDGEVTLSACYPTIESATPEHHGWDIRQNPQTDLLLAQPVTAPYGTEKPIALSFGHVLHQLKVNLQAEGSMSAEQLAKAHITCSNVLSTADLQLLEGRVLSASGEKCSLSAEGMKATFLLPAQEAGDIEVAIALGGRTVTYRLAECEVNGQKVTSLKSGHVLSLTVKVSEGAFTVTGQEITGWENQGDINDTIIL